MLKIPYTAYISRDANFAKSTKIPNSWILISRVMPCVPCGYRIKLIFADFNFANFSKTQKNAKFNPREIYAVYGN